MSNAVSSCYKMRAGSPFDTQAEVEKIYTAAAFQLALAISDKGKDFSSRFPKIVVE